MCGVLLPMSLVRRSLTSRRVDGSLVRVRRHGRDMTALSGDSLEL
jgi:hypothetical protein